MLGWLPLHESSYLAAVSAGHDRLPQGLVGRHPLANRFMKGVRCLHPGKTRRVITWHLDIVLSALTQVPFEPLELASLKHLSMEVAFLLGITST